MDRPAHQVNPPPARRPRFYWFALALLVFVLTLQLASVILITAHWNDAKVLGITWEQTGNSWFATAIRRPPISGDELRPGDRLVAVNSDPRASYLGIFPWLAKSSRSELLRIEVERSGQRISSEYEVLRRPASAFRVSSLLAMSLSTLLMAALMGLIRPTFATARLGYWAGMTASLMFLTAVTDVWRESFQGWERLVCLFAVHPLQFAVGYHFLAQFPTPVKESAFWRRLRAVLYALAVWLWLPMFVWRTAVTLGVDARRSQLLGPENLLRWHDASFSIVGPLFYALAAMAMLAVVVRNYRGLRDRLDRLRMRYGAMGAVPALVALLVVGILRLFYRLLGGEMLAGVIDVASRGASLLVALAPISLAYAVLKHRLLGIRLVIRRGLQYLLAKRSLQLILLFPVLMIAAEIARNPNRSFADFLRQQSLTFYLIFSAGAALSLRYRKRIEAWVDRKFFRTAYSQERILFELLDEVKQADSVHEVSMLVASKINAALHPKDICICYRRERTEGFTMAYPETARSDRVMRMLQAQDVLDALGSSQSQPIVIASKTEAEAGEPIDVPETSLVVPLIGADQQLAGVLWLDEKKSEEPYSDRDRDVLQAIAGQMAMVYENLQLKEKLLEEQRVRINVIGRLDRQAINLLKECPQCGACYDRAVEHCTLDGAELTMATPVARIIDKKYRLDRRLAVGGMGSVYEAIDLRLNRKVAVKIMMGRLFGNRHAIRRFEREARAAARLNHPNIVTIFDFGPLEGDGAYLVMEYLDGSALRDEMLRRLIPGRDAAPWVDQLCQAMSAAHAAGIVHRDLKPENIVLSRGAAGDRITVLDFGLAKIRDIELADANQSGLTATGVVMGTLRYMSPEQLAGKELDPRSDLYSLGLVVIEMLFGGFPTRSRDVLSWAETRAQVEASRHRGWNAEPLMSIFRRLLAASPEDRYPAAEDLRLDLVHALAACPDFGMPATAALQSQVTPTLPAQNHDG